MEIYFDQIGFPVPSYTNPAEFILDLVSADFNDDLYQVKKIQLAWSRSSEGVAAKAMIECMEAMERKQPLSEDGLSSPRPGVLRIIMSLLHRSFIKSYRDVVAYGIRIVMYLGLAIMMGTVWLRLHPSQESIQPFINAIVRGHAFKAEFGLTRSQFFGSAFMSFMAVAYVPAFLEDRATLVKERANGLYGPMPFIVSNFIIGLPFLCKTLSYAPAL